MTDDTIVKFRETVAERLKAALDGVEVLTHKTANVHAAIEANLARAGGRPVAFVRIVSARERGSQTLRPTYDVLFVVECAETPQFNKRGPDAWTLACTVVSHLKLLDVSGDWGRGQVVTTEEAIAEITPENAPAQLIVGVPFSATIAGLPRSTTN